MRTTVVVLGLLVACKKKDPPASDPQVPVCPRPVSATVDMGDANGDGHADVADAVWIARTCASAGPAPVCAAAADLTADGRLELDDAFSAMLRTYEGAWPVEPLAPGTCAPPSVAVPDCLDDAVAAVVVPETASQTFEATVTITTDAPVEAWSLSLVARGCTLEGATTEGTPAALTVDGGQRDLGYDGTWTTSDSVTSTVVLGWMDRIALAGGEHALLRLSVRPDPGCTTCTLALEDGTTAIGDPVNNLIVVDGFAHPIRAEATVACSG